MRGKLRPEEWKPLIASSLLYALRTTRLTFIMPRIALTLFFVLGGMLILGYAVRSDWILVPIVPAVYGVVALLVGVAILAREERKLILSIDRRVVNLLGAHLRDVLAKIEREVHQPMATPRLSPMLSFRPTIRERMENLANLKEA